MQTFIIILILMVRCVGFIPLFFRNMFHRILQGIDCINECLSFLFLDEYYWGKIKLLEDEKLP